MFVDRLDAAQMTWFARQADHLRATVYNHEYLRGQMRDLVPMALDPAPFGAKTIRVLTFDKVGYAKLISNYADDLPNVAAFARETTYTTVEYGDSYIYSFFDIARMQRLGQNLPSMLATVAKESIEQKIDYSFAYGEPAAGLTGLFNNPFVPTSTVATSTGGAVTWADKALENPVLIYKDVYDAYQSAITTSFGKESPTRLLIPHTAVPLIDALPTNDTDKRTPRQMLQQSIPGLEIVPCWRASASLSIDPETGAQALAGDMFVLYTPDATKVYREEPLPFTQRPPQERNLAYVTNCLASSGGVQFPFPLSAAYRTGI